MMIRIPQEKIDKLRSMLQPIILKKKVKVKHLESLTGLMAFCSKASDEELLPAKKKSSK
jgi:hypothetical protein